MTMQELIAALEHRGEVEPARGEQLATWKADVTALFASLEAWLAPAVHAKVLTCGTSTVVLNEAGFGSFDAPLFWIKDGRVTVVVEPVGVRVSEVVVSGGKRLLGLRGRVDITLGPHRIPLVLSGKTREWTAAPTRGEPTPLSESVFAEILSELLLAR